MAGFGGRHTHPPQAREHEPDTQLNRGSWSGTAPLIFAGPPLGASSAIQPRSPGVPILGPGPRYAATLSNVGVPAPEVAERAGHSAEVLLRVYAKCLDGGEDIANRRIGAALQDA